MATLVLLIGFCARILYIRGKGYNEDDETNYLTDAFYIVAYAYFIYALNLFLAFLTPRFDPAAQASELSTTGKSESGGDTAILPVKGDDEFRPFVRRLPEFKFWWGRTGVWLLFEYPKIIPIGVPSVSPSTGSCLTEVFAAPVTVVRTEQAFCDQGHPDRLHLPAHPAAERAGILADPGRLLRHSLHADHEAANQAYD
ncbi:MAG: Rer1 family-domain-containing protein [Olpidium bornovanus]|uniref:Rer1 family-domain-containing protein n=1 Tax=Olpidium bornovanus TaxID=278681 RepID=A0A8H8DLE4_9FUNG|nr:MAG: Rer1 family-domain-containing protein [Olpidium bornovanus]